MGDKTIYAVAAAGATLACGVGHKLYKSNKKKAEEKRLKEKSLRKEQQQKEREEQAARLKKEKEEKEKIQRENLEIAAATIEEFEASWRDNGNSVVVIDSNIWMEQKYHQLFEALPDQMKLLNSSITISSVQLDEIVNLKNLAYQNPKSKLARRAMNRMEKMQKKGVLDLSTDSHESRKGAYADRAILELISKPGIDLSRAKVVSDDRELRMRAFQILKDAGATSFDVLAGDEFQTNFFSYCEAVALISSEAGA